MACFDGWNIEKLLILNTSVFCSTRSWFNSVIRWTGENCLEQMQQLFALANRIDVRALADRKLQ